MVQEISYLSSGGSGGGGILYGQQSVVIILVCFIEYIHNKIVPQNGTTEWCYKMQAQLMVNEQYTHNHKH
jgi:hypothetical protein